MECGCSCDYYDGDYEPIELYERKWRVARKTHQCIECLREIKPKEKYEWHKMKYDDTWWEGKTCNQCVSIRDDYGCGSHGNLREEIWECLGIDIVTGKIKDDI
jgi:hypothetical protein